jgi:hypothetical protein
MFNFIQITAKMFAEMDANQDAIVNQNDPFLGDHLVLEAFDNFDEVVLFLDMVDFPVRVNPETVLTLIPVTSE